MENSKIREITHFTHLNAWKKNHELVLEIYKITKKFPGEEMFGITSQIRRAASSITANIAEGYGRYHYKDKVKFYLISRGSSSEVQDFLITARDLEYISKKDFDRIKIISFEGYKLICGLIRSTTSREK
jgi:four helix bundle protein